MFAIILGSVPSQFLSVLINSTSREGPSSCFNFGPTSQRCLPDTVAPKAHETQQRPISVEQNPWGEYVCLCLDRHSRQQRKTPSPLPRHQDFPPSGPNRGVLICPVAGCVARDGFFLKNDSRMSCFSVWRRGLKMGFGNSVVPDPPPLGGRVSAVGSCPTALGSSRVFRKKPAPGNPGPQPVPTEPHAPRAQTWKSTGSEAARSGPTIWSGPAPPPGLSAPSP